MPDLNSKVPPVVIFVIFDFIYLFTIHYHAKCHLPISKYTLGIFTKAKAKYKFHVNNIWTFYISQKYLL